MSLCPFLSLPDLSLARARALTHSLTFSLARTCSLSLSCSFSQYRGSRDHLKRSAKEPVMRSGVIVANII